MKSATPWNIRIVNDCLFVDSTESGRVVLQHNAHPGLRPYIHPLRGPGGIGCLTEDSPWHHPWQHGISTGFHGVNGCDFWYDPGQKPEAAIGSIEPSAPRLIAAGPPEWAVEAVWRHTDGSYLLTERQTWSLHRAEEVLYLDLDWCMQAIPHVRIDQQSYGGFFLRMPYREDRGGAVINSSGIRDDECEQQAAAWIDLYMPIDAGDTGGGITICDHPGNPGHPARWRVDGNRGINPSPCIPGAIELASGEAMHHRYRLILHREPLTTERIQEYWGTYISTV